MFAERIQERVKFLKRFATSPGSIGSVTPSSRYLVEQILNSVDWNQVNRVVELGGGTGVITRGILQRKQKSTALHVFEKDAKLRQFLQLKHAEISFHEDALRLSEQLQQTENRLGEEGVSSVDCIISGLPFTNFSLSMQEKLLDEIQKSLKPGGKFIAFQYSLQLKKQLNDRFDQVDVKLVFRNLPPSFVYVCQSKIK